MANTSNVQSKIRFPDSTPSSFQRLLNWVTSNAWYVHATSHIHLVLSPSQTYKVLEAASKPSVKRLGLRKLYIRGRRYFIRPRSAGGFQMMTTNKVWWHPKRRTQPVTILSAEFEEIDGTQHRLKTHSRVKLRYLLGQFIWPTFISSIVIFLDWSPIFIATAILGLYGFSWATFRFNAMLESHEITFFIETVLEDFAPEPPQQLSTGDADLTVDDFSVEWDRYVEAKK